MDHEEAEDKEYQAFCWRLDQWNALVKEARVYFRARDWQRARDLYRSAVAVSPFELVHPLPAERLGAWYDTWLTGMDLCRAQCYRQLGRCCIRLKEKEAARRAFESACIVSPEEWANWGNLGVQELRMHRWRDAWNHLARAGQMEKAQRLSGSGPAGGVSRGGG